MNVLGTLPEVLHASIITEWLQWSEVTRLDSAICSANQRRNYLNSISQRSCLFSRFNNSKDGNPTVQGMLDRRVRVRDVVFDESLGTDVTERRALLNHLGANVEWIVVDRCYKSKVIEADVLKDVMFYCPNITKIKLFSRSDSDSSLCDLIRASTKLKSLYLNDRKITLPLLSTICTCSTLRDVFFESCDLHGDAVNYAGSSKHVTSLSCDESDTLYKFFPNILELDADDIHVNILDTLVVQCRRLQKAILNVERSNSAPEPVIPHSTVLKIVENWKHIQSLIVDDGHSNTMSEKSVAALVTGCASLTHFATPFRCCRSPRLVSSTKMKILDNSFGPQLQFLDIDCLCASTLQTIISPCKMLHTLRLRHPESGIVCVPPELAHLFVESALHCIAQSNVATLHLCNYTRLCDEHVLQLQHSKLNTLVITKPSRNLTVHGITNLVATLPNLNTLELHQCRGVVFDVCLQVPPLCPALRTFSFAQGEAYGMQDSGAVMDKLLHLAYPHVTKFSVTC